MRTFTRIMLLMAYTVALALILASCAQTGPLTRAPDPTSVSGTFTLHIMQDEAGYNATRAAVIDAEGDGLTIVPFISRYNLRTYTGLSISKAMDLSTEAISTHCAYTGQSLKRLVAVGGHIAGFEIIPSYSPFICESAPLVSLSYFDKGGGTIRVVLTVTAKWEGD